MKLIHQRFILLPLVCSQDALGWIKSNFKLYHKHHVLALVINARDAKNLTEQVMDCYRGKKNANTIRI
jgi:hypothetical protein